MAKSKQSDKDKFRGHFLHPHGVYHTTSPQAREQRLAEQRAKEHARLERFRQSCEKGRRFLSGKEILEYWLTQAENAISGPKKYWGDTKKFSWPKDKAIIYAVMMICIENTGSGIRVIPDSLRQTKYYKFNEYIFTWVEECNLAVEFIDYIEADLKEEGLLPSVELESLVMLAEGKGLLEPVSKLLKPAVRRKSKSRKKTPPQLLKKVRERQAAKELAKNPNITAEKLGKILDCNKSTVTRLNAWQKKTVLDYEMPPNGWKQNINEDGPDIEAIDKSH